MEQNEEAIRNKVYNISVVFEELKSFPHTYGTILKQFNSPYHSLRKILNRKLNSACKDGYICASTIPNTRFGQALFYCPDKKYIIIFESGRIGCETYYLYEYKKEKFDIITERYWKLEENEWEEYREKKTFFTGKILKIV